STRRVCPGPSPPPAAGPWGCASRPRVSCSCATRTRGWFPWTPAGAPPCSRRRPKECRSASRTTWTSPRDGTVYFSDASDRFRQPDYLLDLFEARPHGRLLRYDPGSRRTIVLLRDLYFANGVALSQGEDF